MAKLPEFDRSAVKSITKLPPKPSGRTAEPSELDEYIKSAQADGMPKEFPPLSDVKSDENAPSPCTVVQRELRRAAKMAGVKIWVRLTPPDASGDRVISFKVSDANPEPGEEGVAEGDETVTANRRRGRRS